MGAAARKTRDPEPRPGRNLDDRQNRACRSRRTSTSTSTSDHRRDGTGAQRPGARLARPHRPGRRTRDRLQGPFADPARRREPYPHEHFRDRWNQATTAAARAVVLADARDHLEALRKTPDPPEGMLEPGSFPWKRMIANDPREPTELARVYGASRQSIHTWRKAFRDEGCRGRVRRAASRAERT
jgi:hypothetical protein